MLDWEKRYGPQSLNIDSSNRYEGESLVAIAFISFLKLLNVFTLILLTLRKWYCFLVAGFISISIFSCENTEQTLKEIANKAQMPLGIANDIRMVYTDSAKVKAILKAPLYVDYTNLAFQYYEFPEGLNVTFFDENENESKLVADYGILYNATKIIDLKRNVHLFSHDGSELTTQQLYWDSEKDWIFTEEPFTYRDVDYTFDAIRLDTNREFTKFQTGKLTGTVNMKEEPSDSLP